MFEGIFNECDKDERRHHLFRGHFRQVEVDSHAAGIPDAHQFHIVVQKLRLFLQRRQRFVAIVEHVSHQFREHLNRLLRLCWVDAHQRVDIVERVHEEMWVDLVFQVGQLLVEVFMLQLQHALFDVERSEEIFHPHVHPQQKQEEPEEHHFAPADVIPLVALAEVVVGLPGLVAAVLPHILLHALFLVFPSSRVFGRERLVGRHGLFLLWAWRLHEALLGHFLEKLAAHHLPV